MALASVIIRTEGRRPRLLAQAVDSVWAQTSGNVEVVLVRDGSGGPVLDPPSPPAGFSLIRLEIAKAGRSAAGNAGLEAATAPLVCFLDDDDWLRPGHVAALSAVLAANPDAGAAYGLSDEIRVRGKDAREVSRRVAGRVPFSLARLWLGNYLPIQSVLFRRGLFETFGGFDTGLDALEDWDLWLRYSIHASFIGVAEVTSAYRVTADRREELRRAKTHAPAMEILRTRHAELGTRLSMADIVGLDHDIRSRLDEYAGARWALGRLWRRLRDGR